MLDPYENLANAVVLQAVKDWRDSIKALKKCGLKATVKGIPAISLKNNTERFFQSKCFRIFTTLDGNMILARLRKESGE